MSNLEYHLAPPRRASAAPILDPHQQRVVDHAGGPLLVLAGPGTGKTTTLVEAIVERVSNRGSAPESVLALTFSRKAAEQLRDRVTSRLGLTTATNLASTFHSFAYGLIRAFAPADLYEGPLRLLSAPEQDVIIQQLLEVTPESVPWPESLKYAVGTRGFASEVQSVLSRAREKGLEGADLLALGRAHDQPAYAAAGLFLDQYLTVLDSMGAVDYSDLIRRAAHVAQEHRDELRRRYRHVFVDEYQDTDPGQVALLQAIAGDGRDLVVVGDPHQSIYAFRGAEVRGILEFPDTFAQASGERAPIAVLGVTRRFGPHLLLAAQRVAGRLPLPPALDAETRAEFASPRSENPVLGQVEALTFDSDRAEAEHIADLLRRAHLEDAVAWSDMAVLARSGRATLPGLRRALSGAGVPVDVARDETPLVEEPAVRTLVAALGAILHLDDQERGRSGYLDAQGAHALLQSPLAGLDASDIRVLARTLRAAEKKRAAVAGEAPRSSPELLRVVVLDPASLGVSGEDPDQPVRRAVALAGLLRSGHEQLLDGAASDEILWDLWSGTTWPDRLLKGSRRTGASALAAHRDLDAVCALFDEAARIEDRRGHTGLATFLATLVAQQIPADTLAEQGIRGDCVRLMTAHRAKGLEWKLVVVAHVQEEGWPDLRRRASLLQADRIGQHELVPAPTSRELLADERRLFYVACTRAAERLVVTAVASPDQDGEQASRFIDELGVRARHVSGRPRRPLSLAGLVAHLRRTASDPDVSADLRGAAVRRLAHLTAEHRAGRVRVPGADPLNWWGTRGASRSDQSLRPPGDPVVISASALTSLELCPTKWFLESEAGGVRASTQSQGFGNIVHALADRVGRGELAADHGLIDDLMTHVDQVWGQIPFRTPWSGDRERAEVRAALTRFLTWHLRAEAREVIGTERRITAAVDLPDGERVLLNGYADRIELDADGRVVVIDLKTGKYPPSKDETTVHPQLGLYQLAVENGAVDDVLPQGATSGGAELWQLRHDTYKKLKVQHQTPQEPDEDGVRPIERQLMNAAAALRAEEFPARPGTHCELCDFQRLCPAQNSGTVLS